MSLLFKIDHYSVSSVTTWRKCQRQWWAKYVEGKDQPAGEAASFGIQYDMMIAQRIGCKLGKPEKMPESWVDGVAEAVDGYLCQPHALKTATQAQVPVRVTPDEWNVLCEMQGFYAEIKKPIIGFADLVDELKRIVVDLKTSSRKDTRDEWALQVLFYSIALALVEARIHLFTRTKVGAYYDFMVPIHGASKKWAMIVLTRAINEIEVALENGAGDELVRLPGYHCAWCPENLDCCARNLIIGG